MKESDTAIRSYVTKPKLYDEAIHVRAKAGTKSRIDALRGDTRQGDFVRELIEEGLERRERGASKSKKS
jgi:tryptophan 2,3-dioxygenase